MSKYAPLKSFLVRLEGIMKISGRPCRKCIKKVRKDTSSKFKQMTHETAEQKEEIMQTKKFELRT
jgi:hypothetical protein